MFELRSVWRSGDAQVSDVFLILSLTRHSSSCQELEDYSHSGSFFYSVLSRACATISPVGVSRVYSGSLFMEAHNRILLMMFVLSCGIAETNRRKVKSHAAQLN